MHTDRFIKRFVLPAMAAVLAMWVWNAASAKAATFNPFQPKVSSSGGSAAPAPAVVVSPSSTVFAPSPRAAPTSPINPNPIYVSVNNAAPAAPGGQAIFTISLSQATLAPITVDYGTGDGTDGDAAVANTNYTPVGGSHTFQPNGATTFMVSVPLVANSTSMNLTFKMNITKVTGDNAFVGDPRGNGTITPGSSGGGGPKFSVSDPTVTFSGTTGTKTLDFVITLNTAVNAPTSVVFSTSDGSAHQPGDYTQIQNLTVQFKPNQLQETIRVTVKARPTGTPDRTVKATLSNPKGGPGLAKNTGTGTIMYPG